VYSAPEILLDDGPSPASDVWACAVLVYFLVSAHSFLFPSHRGISNEVLRSMTLLLGRLPEHLWLKWADRGSISMRVVAYEPRERAWLKLSS